MWKKIKTSYHLANSIKEYFFLEEYLLMLISLMACWFSLATNHSPQVSWFLPAVMVVFIAMRRFTFFFMDNFYTIISLPFKPVKWTLTGIKFIFGKTKLYLNLGSK